MKQLREVWETLNSGGLVTIGIVFIITVILFAAAFIYALGAAAWEWCKKWM